MDASVIFHKVDVHTVGLKISVAAKYLYPVCRGLGSRRSLARRLLDSIAVLCGLRVTASAFEQRLHPLAGCVSVLRDFVRQSGIESSLTTQ